MVIIIDMIHAIIDTAVKIMVFILNMIHAILDTDKDHGIYTIHDTCNYKRRYKVIFILYLDTGREYHIFN